MDAEEAERSGLVSRVVPAKKLIEEALGAAQKIAAALGYVGLAGLDRVGMITMSGKSHETLPAIRGKAAALHKLARATPEYADMLRTALLLESDNEWRVFFDRERSRVEQALAFGG